MNESIRTEALKNVVASLVKFAVHDGGCARVNYKGPQPPPQACTCGLQKVYNRIDELIE